MAIAPLIRLTIFSTGFAVFSSLFANASANEGTVTAAASSSHVPQQTNTTTEPGVYGLLPCLRQAPPYPSAALRAGEEGKALIGFAVQEKGEVREPAIQQSSGSVRLDAAALAHVEHCIAVANAKADAGLTPGRYVLPIEFRLE